MGRNVTVVLEDDVALWARVEAARRDSSVSRLLGDLLKQQMSREMGYEHASLPVALARSHRPDSCPHRRRKVGTFTPAWAGSRLCAVFS